MPLSQLTATRILTEILSDELVIASVGFPAFDLYRARDRAENFYTWGGMGLASSMGLGFALARPSRRIVVLDGDGSILMNLGSWATIGTVAPKRLVHIVWDNGMYELTGAQPTHSATNTDLAAVARACGIVNVLEASDEDGFRTAAQQALTADAPTVLIVKTGRRSKDDSLDMDSVNRMRNRYINTELFMEAAGVLPVGTTGPAPVQKR